MVNILLGKIFKVPNIVKFLKYLCDINNLLTGVTILKMK